MQNLPNPKSGLGLAPPFTRPLTYASPTSRYLSSSISTFRKLRISRLSALPQMPPRDSVANLQSSPITRSSIEELVVTVLLGDAFSGSAFSLNSISDVFDVSSTASFNVASMCVLSIEPPYNSLGCSFLKVPSELWFLYETRVCSCI